MDEIEKEEKRKKGERIYLWAFWGGIILLMTLSIYMGGCDGGPLHERTLKDDLSR